VHAFWKAVLNHTEALSKLVRDTKLTVTAWDKQRRIMESPKEHDALTLGFATFFLNRTNRSGILNGGIIGGRDQTGPWKIDARYNARELVNYIKGRDLYYDFYQPEDHAGVAEFVRNGIKNQRWIVSYDNAPPIRQLYKGSPHVVYDIGYSARSASQGSEVMFFCDGLAIPSLVGSITLTEDHRHDNCIRKRA
jgi:DNA adenine methylase